MVRCFAIWATHSHDGEDHQRGEDGEVHLQRRLMGRGGVPLWVRAAFAG
jgi:hypothetical protein